MCRDSRRGLATIGLALLLVAGCAVRAPSRGVGRATAGKGARLDDPGLLLLLSDRRMYEPYSVRQILEGRPEQHRGLAVALGRIGESRGRLVLEQLLQDPRVEVRREAVFALGRLGEIEAEPALLAALADADRGVGIGAAGALARLGSPLAGVLRALSTLPEPERLARALPRLFRFPAEELLESAREGLAATDPELRRRAAYALARKPLPAARSELLSLLENPDPWLRGWGARALADVGETADLDRLEPLLYDVEPGPIVQALRTARSLVRSGRVAAPAGWRPRILELLEDPRPGVRVSAVEASALWLRDEALATKLLLRARVGALYEREAALRALAEGEEPVAVQAAEEASRSEEPWLRAAAVEAAAIAGRPSIVSRLAADPEPLVRLAVLAARLRTAPEAAAVAAREALKDLDPAVRAAALDWLTEEPLVAVEELAMALADTRSGLGALRISGTRAIAARGRAATLERGLAVAALEELASDPERPVRLAAGAGLEELGRPVPPIGPVETKLNLRGYRALAERLDDEMLVELVTSHGVLKIRLEPQSAPLTCLNFLQLASLGFYDGLRFHRVVPDFVVQAGDPRGDGWGGPGYAIRDENNQLPYLRGTVGMARSGPDTAGSQFFITLSEQPHLEGEYTAFGRVVSGDEVLDAIARGDLIERVRRVDR